MGGCIDKCCWGTFGARCCNVISLVGFIYFGLNFLIFEQQKNFYQFHMEEPENTRWSFLICSALYLLFFIMTFFRINQLNKHKQSQKTHVHSINDNPKPVNANMNMSQSDNSIRNMAH